MSRRPWLLLSLLLSACGARPATFDVARAPDGSFWIAGHHQVHKLEVLGP